MKDDLSAFMATLDRMTALLDSIPEKLATISPRPGDWSVKEIACHLIDSASNNHQRFTRLQRTSRLEFPAYEPEPWVAVEKPSDMAFSDLLALFKAYNTFILHLVRTMDRACLSHVWIVDGSEKTLDFLMRDYYRHLDWHIHHLEQRLEDISRSQQAAPHACGSSMTIPTASINDAAAILALQKLAYQSEAALYDDFSIPPLVQTLAEMEEDLRTQVVVKATANGEIVASARAFERDGTVFIGRVIVHPRLQGQGLGKQIMAAIESRFPNARRFELFTGERSARNLRFYRSLGYQDFKTEQLTPVIQFVYLEKLVPTPIP